MLSKVRGSSRASWWVTFVLLAALGGFWALGSPPTGAPDERDHVINASAVARGDLVGDRLTCAERAALVPGNGQKSAYRSLDAPALYGRTNTGCFAFRKEVTAACLHLSGSTRVVPVVTNVTWYPPRHRRARRPADPAGAGGVEGDLRHAPGDRRPDGGAADLRGREPPSGAGVAAATPRLPGRAHADGPVPGRGR